MASNAIKSPLPGDSLDPSEVRAKAALDERDEKSIIRVGYGSTAFDTRNVSFFVSHIFYDASTSIMHEADTIQPPSQIAYVVMVISSYVYAYTYSSRFVYIRV